MSLLLMVMPLLPMAIVVVEPLPKIALVGRLAPEGPISQLEMVLLSLPFAVTASIEKMIVAPMVDKEALLAPFIEHLVMVLDVAPPTKRMVQVPYVTDTVVFSIVSELPQYSIHQKLHYRHHLNQSLATPQLQPQ